MRKGWTKTTLGAIAELTTGSRAKGGAISSGIPSIGGEQIAEDRSIKFNKMKFIPEEHFKSMRAGKLEFGDSLLVKDGATTGKVGYWGYNTPAAVNEHVFILRARPDKVEPYFVNLLISQQSFRKEIEARTRGIIGGITRDIEKIEFKIPPLREQKRIVDLISSVDSYINALEQQADSARKSRSAVLHEMFSAVGEGWRETTLGEICEFQNGDRGKNYPSESKRQKFGIPFINAGHLTNRKIDFSEMDYISEETFNKLGSGKIRSGDILFCLRGSVGKFGSTGNLKQGAIASSLVILRAKEIARAGFILGFLDSENFKQQIESILTGAVQPNLSASNLKVVELHLPPLQVQDEILVMLDSFDRNVSIIEKLISETKRLRSGLLSELLSGEHEIPASYDGVMGAA